MKSLNTYIAEKLIINQQVNERLVINKNYRGDFSIKALEKFWEDDFYEKYISKENINNPGIFKGLYDFILSNLQTACNEVSSGITDYDELDNVFPKILKKEIAKIKLKTTYVDAFGISIYSMNKEFTDIENMWEELPEKDVLYCTSFDITVNYIRINIDVIIFEDYIVVRTFDVVCECRMGLMIIKIDRA